MEGASAELLLDTAVTKLEELLTEITLITREIDDTEDNLRARLDNARNRMLKVGVGFGVMTVWITAAQIVSLSPASRESLDLLCPRLSYQRHSVIPGTVVPFTGACILPGLTLRPPLANAVLSPDCDHGRAESPQRVVNQGFARAGSTS